jgi:RsiW-degrading membrane proteinase PrsW (M82 family)
VYKCGAPIEFGLPVETDNLDKDELAFFNIINFDNYGRAMLSIFVAITLEGWVLMMYNYMDSFQPTFSVVFFVFLVVFGAFFALNLVLAQIMESFYAQRGEDLLAQERQAREAEKEEIREL